MRANPSGVHDLTVAREMACTRNDAAYEREGLLNPPAVTATRALYGCRAWNGLGSNVILHLKRDLGVNCGASKSFQNIARKEGRPRCKADPVFLGKLQSAEWPNRPVPGAADDRNSLIPVVDVSFLRRVALRGVSLPPPPSLCPTRNSTPRLNAPRKNTSSLAATPVRIMRRTCGQPPGRSEQRCR